MRILTVSYLLEKLKGIHTIESIASILKTTKRKAIYYVYRLRKAGYVKTKKTSENKRVYDISFENKLGGKDYIEIINSYSPVKVYPSQDYKIYGRSISPEEALVFAITSKDLRIILASLSLFRKIKNWKLLYTLVKEKNIKKEIGILYDLSRRIMRTRRMPKKFRRNIQPIKNKRYPHLVDKLKSDDFKDLEKIWGVYLPFNNADLTGYRK